MSDGWTIPANPATVTVPTGESRQVVVTVTNVDSSPRLADLKIVFDPGTAHPSWFTIDAPSIVPSGRSAKVAVQVEPRVAALGFGETYTFAFRGQVGSAVDGDVSVTVSGRARWQVTVSPEQQDVSSPGGYLVVYTVTNLSADAATAVLEAPYQDPRMLVAVPVIGMTEYHLDEGQQLIQGFASAAFTLRVDVTFVNTGSSETVEGRVTTAGASDVVLCPPTTVHYVIESLTLPPIKIPVGKVTEPGKWNLTETA
jgi:hypothetical protein